MVLQYERLNILRYIITLLITLLIPLSSYSQENEADISERDKYITIAREIIETAHYCALITLDQFGKPHVRMMEPVSHQDDMVVWLGTNSKSRKVQEIRNNPQVTLYYSDHEGGSYVAIAGTANLIDDPEKKDRLWREEWDTLFPGWKNNFYILIQVIPNRLEILSYMHGIVGDPETWEAPHIDF